MAELIYLVEDDPNVSELIRCTLTSFSYEMKCFDSAEAMFEACDGGRLPALFILDIMLPGMDGIRALRRLRESGETAGVPVVMLTAKSGEVDKVTGLDSGADDYIAKPFGVLELAARVRAVLRRRPGMNVASVLSHKDIVIDCDRHMVFVGGEPVALTLKEFELLLCLMRNSQRVMTRDELLNLVWGYEFAGESRTLDMHIRSLRAKLGDDAEKPIYIKTVRGIGYTMA
ncbi:MAG: response regulator transcription factor [Clostridia bacterium]|nr:response regulator transcription factor [Clostridia bacterium]